VVQEEVKKICSDLKMTYMSMSAFS